MSCRALRELILKAVHGSVITGLALTGCADGTKERPPSSPDQAGKGGAGAAARGGSSGEDAELSGRAAGGGAGGELAAGCFRNPVGVCCRTEVCFAPPSGSHLDAAASQDDAGVAGMCPNKRANDGFCTSYGELLPSSPQGECCYVQTTGSCCGRPFMDGQHVLSASLRARSDWMDGSAAGPALVDDVTRRALAHVWLRDARMEHASIASFAHFTLQALALGAPAELIAEAQRAGLDEVAHATACFALASRYRGAALGPTELPMPSRLCVASLTDATAAAVREGCVAETLAALVVSEQLARATDSDVRAALTRIARDEARHAELAYRFVRWAISIGGAPVRDAVQTAFASARAEVLAASEPMFDVAIDVTAWHVHGRLTSTEERACMLAGLSQVIEPCQQALLAS